MKRTNIWDFACKHPIIFSLLIGVVATSVVTIVTSFTNDEDKENNIEKEN